MHKFHYDPAQLRRLHTVCFSLEGAAVEESAFRAPGRRDLYPAAHQRHRDRVLPRHAGTVRRLDAFPR